MSNSEHSPSPQNDMKPQRESRRMKNDKRRSQNGDDNDDKHSSNGSVKGAAIRRRSMSKSRSRSRSRSEHKKRKHHKRTRSRSPSDSRNHRRSDEKYRRSRSRSHTPNYRRRYSPAPTYVRKEFGPPLNPPPPSRCLGVFGMSMYTDEASLQRIFSSYGPIESIQIVYDRQSNRSRGFAFIYFENVDDAIRAKDRAVGQEIDGQRVRIDFSVTKGPHQPTPGIYAGRPGSGYRRDDYNDRRPSRRSRSRSPRRNY